MHATKVLQKCLGNALGSMHALRSRVLLHAVEAMIQGSRLTLIDLARSWPGAERVRAPLKALELTPANLSFLGGLVRKLVTPENRPLTVAEEERIDSGLRALSQLRQQERSFGALRAFLAPA